MELVVNSARALSPLCADNDKAKVGLCVTPASQCSFQFFVQTEVAQGGGSLVIVRSILHHPQNPALLQNGLNCLHKISKQANTLPSLIHQGAVQVAIVAGFWSSVGNDVVRRPLWLR